MSAKSSVIVLLAALSLFMLAIGEQEPALAIIAFFTGGVGITGIIAAAVKRKELPPASAGLEDRVLQLEKRLQVTEDELAASNQLLASLTAERDFDRELFGAARKAIPGGTDGREPG